MASSTPWGVWGAFDEVIRYLDHKSLVNEHLPLQMFTSSELRRQVTKLGADDFAATYAGYEQKYEALWGIKLANDGPRGSHSSWRPAGSPSGSARGPCCVRPT